MKITINEGTSFLITDMFGNIVKGTKEGLFHQDTRFLSSCSLLVDGHEPVLLSSRQINYFTAHHYLTNPPNENVPGNSLSITRVRFVGDGLHEDIDVHNHDENKISCSLQLKFESDFADIFEVKTSKTKEKGTILFDIEEDGKGLSCTYKRGSFFRKLIIGFSQSPKFSQNEVEFDIRLKPNERWHTCIDYLTLVSPEKAKSKHSCKSHEIVEKYKSDELAKWILQSPKIETDYEPLKKAYEQSLIDLGSLRLQGADISGSEVVPAAGVPWFMTFFGRDTLTQILQ